MCEGEDGLCYVINELYWTASKLDRDILQLFSVGLLSSVFHTTFTAIWVTKIKVLHKLHCGHVMT